MYVSVQMAFAPQNDNGRMKRFLNLFVRVGPGKWTCVRSGQYVGPQGRIQVTVGTTVTKGTAFMGVDLAAILERESRAPRNFDGGYHNRPGASEKTSP